MNEIRSSESGSIPPKFPSVHSYFSLSGGVVLPLIVIFLVWKRLGADDFIISKFAWALLWTYPLMILGCLIGEFLARKIYSDFYSTIGDSPAQMANLMTGWIWAHSYLVLMAVLFLFLKKSAT